MFKTIDVVVSFLIAAICVFEAKTPPLESKGNAAPAYLP